MNDDPVPMFMRRHFEYGLTHCVKSVHDVDLLRYEEFKDNIILWSKLIKFNGQMIIEGVVNQL